ncbi:MAG: transposase [Verrucomicrobia bacterium]|jgi:transposase|nr:transposase [Verrucomicrobiota bacterium]
MSDASVFVGIDVSKDNLDVAVKPGNESFAVPNTSKGHDELCKRLRPFKPKLLVVEATGGMELDAVIALCDAGIVVAIVNPRHVRDFAKACGQLAKTDCIDAAILADFADKIRPEPRPMPSEETRALDALITRRRQLVDMLAVEKNRLTTARKAMKKDILRHLAFLEKAIGQMDNDLQKSVEDSPIWRVNDDILQSVPGVGPTCATTLMAQLPELGMLDRKKIAALVGVAPLNRDSGYKTGRRIIWGGRAPVRAVLYMSTLVATRHNPVIRTHYEHLINQGKLRKVAMTACMRKLLTLLNAMIRDQSRWQPEMAMPK